MRLLEYARRLATTLKGRHAADTSLVLNATGGNKLMSLAFFEAFRDLPGARVIYTDTTHERIETLIGEGSPTRPMSGVVDIPTYLAAYGFRRQEAASDGTAWQTAVAARGELTDWLGVNAGRLDKFFNRLNRAAKDAVDRTGMLVRPDCTLGNAPLGGWEKKAMTRFHQAGLIQWEGGAEFSLKGAGQARYLCGGWLEEYAWRVVSRLEPDQVQANVRVSQEGGATGPGNELDLLAVHHNRMLIVECKTARFGRDTDKDADRVYKLESLGRTLGGPFGTRLLLSAQALPAEARERATGQGIRVLEGGQLATLEDSVRRWMRPRPG